MSNMSPPIQETQRSIMRSSALYLTQHGGELHEALDVQVNPTTYSEQRASMELMPSTGVETALKWYKEQNPDVPFDVLNCSWDDVFDQMERAKGKYEDNFKGPNHFFRRLWRKAGKANQAIQPWLELIPNEYGMSVARSAIAILFHMAQESVQKEEKIFGAFDEITDTIALAASKGLSFHGNKEMHQCSVSLYITLLDGVKDLIWTLNPEANGNDAISRYKQKRDRRKTIDIAAMLREVKQKAAELNQCAERILTKATLETRKTVGEVQTELHSVRRTVVDIKGTTEEINVITADIKTTGIETHDKITRLGEDANRFVREFYAATRAQSSQLRAQSNHLDRLDHNIQVMNMYRKRLIDGVDAQNGTLAMFAGMLHDIMASQELIMQQNRARIDHERELSRRPRTPAADYIPAVTLPNFIEALNVPLSLATSDLDTVLGCDEEFKGRAQRQAQSLLQTKEFSRWLGGRFPDLLLVDGNMDAAAIDSLSAMSLLCGTLIASISRVQPGSIVLHFFCGLHTAPNDPATGPGGMVRTLLTQLATALRTMRRLDLGFIRTDGDMADLHDHRLSTLCATLSHVLMQVPVDTNVFCVIDSVSAFEKNYHNFRADLAYVVRALKRMVTDERRAAFFKVLLTSGSRSIDIARWNIVEKWQHVTLLDSGDGSGNATINHRSVKAALLSSHGSEQFILEGPVDTAFDADLVGDDW